MGEQKDTDTVCSSCLDLSEPVVSTAQVKDDTSDNCDRCGEELSFNQYAHIVEV